MTQNNEMPREVFYDGVCISHEQHTEFPFTMGETHIRRAVTKEEAAMVAEYAKAQGQYLHPSSKLFGKQHRMKCWDIIERMAEAHK